MGVGALRVWSTVGATVLVLGVVLVIVAVTVWRPLSNAPGAWWVLGGVLLTAGLVITVIATSMLARLSRQR